MGLSLSGLVELLEHGVDETSPIGKPDAKQRATLALAHIVQRGERHKHFVAACTRIAELASVHKQGSEER